MSIIGLTKSGRLSFLATHLLGIHVNSLSFLKLFLVQPQTRALKEGETGLRRHPRDERHKGIDVITAATERFSCVQVATRLDPP